MTVERTLEIEAKFTIPDPTVLQALIRCEKLGSFQLVQDRTLQVQDSYRDTAGHDFLRAGFACRVRFKDDERIATLKGLGNADGAVHSRCEYEVTLTVGEAPDEWPESDARALALGLSEGKKVIELFSIRQERHIRTANDGPRAVAEISFDSVSFTTSRQTKVVFEAEAELLPSGSMQHLYELANALQQDWRLEPQSLSKFERGLAILEEKE